MLQLAEVLASGRDVLITPDGPRGPAYRAWAGDHFFSAKIRGANRADQYRIFALLEVPELGQIHSSRVRLPEGSLHFWPLARVAPTNTEEEFEAERRRLQNAMMAQVEMR